MRKRQWSLKLETVHLQHGVDTQVLKPCFFSKFELLEIYFTKEPSAKFLSWLNIPSRQANAVKSALALERNPGPRCTGTKLKKSSAPNVSGSRIVFHSIGLTIVTYLDYHSLFVPFLH